jgi:FKBP-type peptidyl-prolyl cis-trans isomerase FkpA
MRNFIPILIGVSLALPAAAETAVKPESEDEKVIYTMGVSLGRNFVSLGFSQREAEIVSLGLRDALLERELAAEWDVYGPKMNDLATERTARLAAVEAGASKSFLTEAAAVSGAIQTESGLIYSETKAGTGAQPTSTDQVVVHYHGTLRDGTVFDSSRERNEPAKFPLNRVIPCWTEALQRMKVGGQANIVCPPSIAYGDRGMGAIKPGAVLRFEVELISIE